MKRSIIIFISSVLAVLSIAAFGALLGIDPARVLRTITRGAFGSSYAWSETLLKMVPLLLTALSVTIAFRGGAWNIGAEGQFLIGATTALFMARILPPSGIACVLAIAAGAIGGAFWSGIAAMLRITRNTPEVLSTILLNFVAIHFLGYLITGPMQESSRRYPQSEAVDPATTLETIGSGRLHYGIFVALALAAAAWWMIFRSRFGLRLRSIGANASAAAWAGVDVKRTLMTSMLLSGAVAGIAGSIELLGVTHRLYDRFAAGYGYTAIAVALLAALHPLGAIGSAFFFAALSTGSGELQRALAMPSTVALLAQGVAIVLLLAVPALIERRRLS